MKDMLFLVYLSLLVNCIVAIDYIVEQVNKYIPIKTNLLIRWSSSSHFDVKKESYNSWTACTTRRLSSPATDIKPCRKIQTKGGFFKQEL